MDQNNKSCDWEEKLLNLFFIYPCKWFHKGAGNIYVLIVPKKLDFLKIEDNIVELILNANNLILWNKIKVKYWFCLLKKFWNLFGKINLTGDQIFYLSSNLLGFWLSFLSQEKCTHLCHKQVWYFVDMYSIKLLQTI